MKTQASLNEMRGFTVNATDGQIGKVKDFYFDDRTWKLRYVVVALGNAAPGRNVLILPQSLEKTGEWTNSLSLNITREQVEKSPDTDTDMPVSRQHEIAVRHHYGADVYFSWGEGLMGSHNIDLSEYAAPEMTRNKDGKEFDPHLNSFRGVIGFQVRAADGRTGRVQDLIADTDTWVVQYVVVGAGNIFGTKKVLIAPEWVCEINVDETAFMLNVPKMRVHDSPRYDPMELDKWSIGEPDLSKANRP